MNLKRKNEFEGGDLDYNFDDDLKGGLNDNSNDDIFSDNLDDNFFGGGGVPPIEKHNDLLKELTNFAPYLKATVNNWLGVQWNESQEKYIHNKDIVPIMNINGTSWCIGRLQTYARPNNIITDISIKDYNFLQEDIIDEIWINIGTRAEEFGIKNEGDILRVCNEMIHASQLVLMGAGDGRYNKFLGTVTSRHETVNPDARLGQQNMPQKRASFGGRVKKFFLGS